MKRRELCKKCFEWVTAKESSQDIAGCIEADSFEAENYLRGDADTCPFFNKNW